MKALFLIFHGFNPANGISKKIQYQVDALHAEWIQGFATCENQLAGNYA